MVIDQPKVCGKQGLGTVKQIFVFDSAESGLVLDHKNVRGMEGEKREIFTPTARKSVVASISPARLSIYRCVASSFCFRSSISFSLCSAIATDAKKDNRQTDYRSNEDVHVSDDEDVMYYHPRPYAVWSTSPFIVQTENVGPSHRF